MKKLLLLAFSFSFIMAGYSQLKERVVVTDLLKIKSVGNVTLSKDGSKAAFTVTAIEPDGESKLEYKYVTQIWVVATDGISVPRQMTSKENASQPAFSPDGKQLAFVRAADGKSQIFLLSLDGGEATQLTKFRYGASNPTWSPDGKQLLFSSSISFNDLLKDSVLNPGQAPPSWPFEKPGFNKNEFLKSSTAKGNPDGSIEEVRAYLENNVNDKKATVIDKLSFQTELDVSSAMNYNHFFVTSITPGAKPITITKGFYRYNSADFIPGGNQIILSGYNDSLQHPDRMLENEIYITDTEGSNPRLLVGTKDRSYASLAVSPSGKWLAYVQSNPRAVNIPELGIVSIAGGPWAPTIIPFDRNKNNLTWSEDEKYVYFSAPSNGGSPIHRADVKTKKVQQLTEADAGVGSFDLVKDKLAFVQTQVSNPYELFISDASGKNKKQLSRFNDDWISKKQLSFPEKKTFTNEKGQVVEYWIMKPYGFQAGKKYPLLLEIHGGPAAMWGPGEASMWHEYQYFCSQGYGVVYCNPRGSGGYGTEFLKANINDWGTGPTSDVLTALDRTVAENWADTSRLLVTGGSYAGYLVAWIIAHDKRFKAASSQRGVYDLATFFGEGNAWRLVPGYFGGYPWEEQTKKMLERESPINYVQNITTPYIIFHGDNDRRTGFVQSEMLYRSLKVLGRPVEYVRHPGATHELTRSGNNRQRIDQLLRTWEFFERWIRTK
jgi:dipeptidyl aminopeptidase/acylaminoacyl peptidase